MLAVDLPGGAVLQVGAGEELVLAVEAQLAVEADLQRDDGEVEAHAAESVDIGRDAQIGQVVVDGGGVGVLPDVVALLAVPHGGLEVQLDGAAHAEGGGDGHGAHRGVDGEADAHAHAGGEAAAGGEELPFLFLQIIADLSLKVARHWYLNSMSLEVILTFSWMVLPM